MYIVFSITCLTRPKEDSNRYNCVTFSGRSFGTLHATIDFHGVSAVMGGLGVDV